MDNTTADSSGRPPTFREAPSKEVKTRWREWRDEEERLRLGWAIFVSFVTLQPSSCAESAQQTLDSQAAAFLNVPAAFSLNEIQVRLPDTEEMWDTSNASMWDEVRRSRESSRKEELFPFATILAKMVREGRLQEGVSEFGKWIMAHSLYRWVLQIAWSDLELTSAASGCATLLICRIHCWATPNPYIHLFQIPFRVLARGQ